MFTNGSYVNELILNGNTVEKALLNGIVVWQSITTPVDTIPPLTPEYLMESNVTKNSIEVLWLDNMDEDLAGYNVYLNGVKHNSSIVTIAMYTFEGLTPGTQYLIEVSAVDTSNNESNKASLTVSTAAQPQAPVVIVSDTFDRANNTTSLGVADTGQTWQYSGIAIGIYDKQAYEQNNGDGFAFINTGIKDGNIEFKHTYYHQWTKPVFRFVDSNNMLYSEGGSLRKKVNGVNTNLASFTAPVTNDVIAIKFVGDAITVYKNGVEVASAIDSFNNTITKHGFGLSNSIARVDNFKITTV